MGSASGRARPSFAASFGSAVRAEARQGAPSGLRQFSRSQSSVASELRVQTPDSRAPFSHADVSGRNCRVPILMRHDLPLPEIGVKCVGMKGAEDLVAISDGAEWMGNTCEELFGGGKVAFALDMFHALEYAGDAVKAIIPD